MEPSNGIKRKAHRPSRGMLCALWIDMNLLCCAIWIAQYSGKYIKRNEEAIAFELAQKDYNQKLIRAAQKELNQIDRFLSKYSPNEIENIYSKWKKYNLS